jgi:hypothetical protein
MANGMEGGLYAFLLMRTVYYVLATPRFYLASLFGGLLFTARPEGLAVIPICVLYQAAVGKHHDLPVRAIARNYVLPLVAPWAAVVAAVTLWRLTYYGAWLPNTIAAKSVPAWTADYLRINIRDGLIYWRGFLRSAVPLSLGIALAPVLTPRRSATWLCLALPALQVPVVLINGGDWMPHYRLLVTYAPVLAVLFGLSLEGLVRIASTIIPQVRLLQWGTALLSAGGIAVLLQSSMLVHQAGGQGISIRRPQLQLDPQMVLCADHQMIADRIRPALLPSDRVSAEALGIFGYALPGIYVHDMLGLTDHHIAHYGSGYHPRFGKSDLAYTYHAIRPTFILVQSSGLEMFSSGLARASGGTFNDEYLVYELRGAPTEGCAGGYMMVIVRKDSAARILPTLQDLAPQLLAIQAD